jgi:hypothetical protein
MAHIRTTPEIGTKMQVRVCSDTNPQDCVVVGWVLHDAVHLHWWITPETAEPVTDRFENEAEATYVLIERERETWQRVKSEGKKETERAHHTFLLLEEFLDEPRHAAHPPVSD